MPQAAFDPTKYGAKKAAAGTAFDPSQFGAKKVAPLPATENSQFSGFVDEAKKNAGRLYDSVMDTTGGDPNIVKLELPSVVQGAATSPITAVSVARNLPALVKQSPAVQTATAVGATVKGWIDKPRNAVTAITQALKPKATNADFAQTLDRALPEIKAVESQLGKDIETIEDFAEGIKAAKKNVRSQYDAVAGPHRLRGISGDSIADAMERSISQKTLLQEPQRAAAIKEKAATYRGRTFTVEELEDLLTTTNAELESYYGMYPAARSMAKRKNPAIAEKVAEADELRNVVYSAFGDGSEAGRELQKRYGSLMNLEKETQRRLNVTNRQQPNSLTEQMGRLQATFKGAKGAAKVVTGDVMGGVQDMASAYAGRKAASVIKEQNSTNFLIKNVMKHYRITPKPIVFEQRPIAGLLPEQAGGPHAMGEVPFTPSVDVPAGTPKQLNAAPTVVQARPLTVQPSSGRVYPMPGEGPRRLTTGMRMLPERAGGPHAMPRSYTESMIERLRNQSKKK